MISTFGWVVILFILFFIKEFIENLKDAWNLKKKQEQEDECRKNK